MVGWRGRCVRTTMTYVDLSCLYVCVHVKNSFIHGLKSEAILFEVGGVLNVAVEENLEMLLVYFWWLSFLFGLT